MTWYELKEEVKKMGYNYGSFESSEWFSKDRLTFTKDGNVFCVGTIFAEHRTPDQMLAIMKALQ